jgi:uncharacterized protein (DUF697 family)
MEEGMSDLVGSVKTLKGLLDLIGDIAGEATSAEVGRVIKLHAYLAVIPAWIPIDGVDVIGLTINLWWMYARINKALDIPFSENKFKSLVTGFGANILTNLLFFIVGELVKLIPVFGWIAAPFILSIVYYSVTLAAGVAYGWGLAKWMGQNPKTPSLNLDKAQKVQDAFQQVIEKTSEGSKPKELK